MTDEVASLVLDNNRAQTLGLMIARRQALPMANVHARYVHQLEADHWLDRALEFLPTDRQIADRQSAGRGLLTPELAVMMAYTKNADVADILLTDLPDDPALATDLSSYFPGPLRERFPDAIRNHRLRREITTTRLVNQMVNLSGISYDHRMTEDTGASTSDVARAWVAMREIFGFAEQWREIDELGTSITLDTQLDLFLDCRRTAERCSLWLLRHRHPPIDIAATIADFRPGIQSLLVGFDGLLSGRMADSVYSTEAARLAAGVPESLAQRSAIWKLLHTGFDMIEIANREGVPLADRGDRVLAGVRSARPDVAVGCDRRPATFRPLADPGTVSTARRPDDRSRRTGGHRDPTLRRLDRFVDRRQRAPPRAGARDVRRDPAGRGVRSHEPLGRAPTAAEPRADVGARAVASGAS